MPELNDTIRNVTEIEIVSIFTSAGHDFKGRHGMPRKNHPVTMAERAECVAGRGLVGDRYFSIEDGHKGQITFFSAEDVDAARRHFDTPDFCPSAFRRNVIVRGVDLPGLVGSQFTLAGIRFEGSEECRPCYWMDQALAPGAEEFLAGRGGLRARVLTSGVLKCGHTTITRWTPLQSLP